MSTGRTVGGDRFSVHSAVSASAPLRFDRERRLELRSLGAARGRSWALEARGAGVRLQPSTFLHQMAGQALRLPQLFGGLVFTKWLADGFFS